MIDNNSENTVQPTKSRALGLPILGLIGLAALGLPRVILHDLHVIENGPLVWLLAILPVAVWIAVTLLVRSRRPFLTVLVIGAIFGVMLVITHQLLWEVAFAGVLPSVGSGPMSTVFPRIAAIPSGLLTGAGIGAIGGLIAWGLSKLGRR